MRIVRANATRSGPDITCRRSPVVAPSLDEPSSFVNELATFLRKFFARRDLEIPPNPRLYVFRGTRSAVPRRPILDLTGESFL
jgi:hypothetical protein